ncbi:outer membrane protein assembly factor BamB family protein [Halocatena marina]|nr:PQQ-binding-like beta-propeller repeat protein [Halocatena marina]
MNSRDVAVNRRSFLAGTTSILTSFGLFTRDSGGFARGETSTTAGNWTHPGATAGHSGYLPEDVGPTGDITKAWDHSLSRGNNNDGVAVVDDTVYTGGGPLRALNVADGAERWSFDPTVPDLEYHDAGNTPEVQSPAVMDGTVYASVRIGVYDAGDAQHTALIAVDAETGEKRWRVDSDGLSSGLFSPVVAADGAIFTSGPDIDGGTKNWWYAFDGDDGTVRWRRPLKTDTKETLPVADGRLYLPREKGVQALDTATGKTVWTALPRVNTTSTPIVSDGTLFVTEENPPGMTLIALDAATGDEYWRTAYPSSDDYPSLDVGAVDDEHVYIQIHKSDADIIALSRNDGSERWRASIPQPPEQDEGPVMNVPTDGVARVGSLLYVGGAALNPTDGSVAWTHAIPGPWIFGYSLRAVAGGRVYIGGDKLIVLSGTTEQPEPSPPTETLQVGTTTTEPPSTTTERNTETGTLSTTAPSSETSAPATAVPSPTDSNPSDPSPTVSTASEQTTATDGPGFGVASALGGIGLIAWRAFTRNEE